MNDRRDTLFGLGLCCVIYGVGSVILWPLSTGRNGPLRLTVFFGSLLMGITGVVLLLVWACLRVAAAWRRRREQAQRGFDLVPVAPDASVSREPGADRGG